MRKHICSLSSLLYISLIAKKLRQEMGQKYVVYKKITEKSVSRETKCHEMTSQSFPVFCFGYAVLYPTGSEFSRF